MEDKAGGTINVAFRGDSVSINSSKNSHEGAIRTAQEKKKKWYTILVLVSLIPIACLFGLTLYKVIKFARIRHDSVNAKNTAQNFINVDVSIHSLEHEELATNVYLSTGQGLEDVHSAREEVDQSINNFGFGDLTLTGSGESIKQRLDNFRQELAEGRVISGDLHLFYNSMMSTLLDVSGRGLTPPGEGVAWRMLASAWYMLRAAEPLREQEALIRAVVRNCSYTTQQLLRFLNRDGAVDGCMAESFLYYNSKREIYESSLQRDGLLQELQETRQIITSSRFSEKCESFSEAERREEEFLWYEVFHKKSNILREVRNELSLETIEELQKIVKSKESDMLMYIIILLILTLCCGVLITVITRSLSTMVNNDISYATQSKLAVYYISVEKEKEERLLSRLMPAPIARGLTAGREIQPQVITSATFCYVDLVDFVSIISEMEPLQVTEMLDALYRTFDHEVTKHSKVYKMDQSNDVYSVMSGIPAHPPTWSAGDNRAEQVAEFALNTLAAVQGFSTGDVPRGAVKVRAGVHTGPCAAGLVGRKSHRYSVFGAAVKVASRLCRYSTTQKIQISSEMKQELEKHGEQYVIGGRAEIHVHGIGNVTTFFLERK